MLILRVSTVAPQILLLKKFIAENSQDSVHNDGDTQDASDLSEEPSHFSVSFSTAGLPDSLGTHAACTLLSWSE